MIYSMKKLTLSFLTCVFLVIPLTFAQTPQSPDIDGSGEVDILDVLQVVNGFGLTSGFDPRVDLNNDGIINVLDILIIVNNWGQVQNPPIINAFDASPITINPGSDSTLTWSVTNADSLILKPGNVDVTGTTQRTVNPSSTNTIYTLKAANSGGTDFDSVTVRVSANQGAPVINSFTATPGRVSPGGSSTLSWDIDDADSIEIDKIGDVTDSTQVNVNPSGTTSYLLTVSNSNGNSYAMATVSTSSVPLTLKYFSYYGSNYISCSGPSCTAEFADHANVNHVSAQLTKLPELAAEFDGAARNNVRVIVDLSDISFPWPTGQYQADFPQKWLELAEFLKPYESQIVAFNHIDEPYFHVSRYGPSADVLRQQIETVNAAIKAKFPNIPIAVTFAGNYIGEGLIIPQGYDWVGFDCYFFDIGQMWDNCDSSGNSPDYYFDLLNRTKNPHQKIFFVPDGDYFSKEDFTQAIEILKVDIANRYYDMAANEPEVIMMLPYLWTEADGGTREMDLLKTRYNEIGSEISGK
jgi:hypothetical protein